MADLYSDIVSCTDSIRKLVFSQPVESSAPRNVTFRPVIIKHKLYFQNESIQDQKAFHKNYDAQELLKICSSQMIGKYRQVLLSTEEEAVQYVLKNNGTYKKTSRASVKLAGAANSVHDHVKEYILEEGENIPALVDLGVFTKDLKIVRAKYDKYKQINRFVELVDHEFRKTNLTEITILDFGCGKSYLTFILYYYFTCKRGMKARIIGYDLKADVVEHCNRIAESYGYNDLKFIHADVSRDVLCEEPIDMVVTLHACDTATDYALWFAAQHGAKYIFSVPCCQHEVNQSIQTGGDLDILLRYGILKERVSALLTDAVRANVLEYLGYKVDLIEFVDFEHSPKNLMIRAAADGKKRDEKLQEALALSDKYSFRQKLLDLVSENEKI